MTQQFYAFSELVDPTDRLQWLAIGAGSQCHIVINDETVSTVHCLVLCTKSRVLAKDAGSKNRTLINTVPILEGPVELRPGNVLSIGNSLLVACGSRGIEQPPDIVAHNLDGYLRETVKTHGTMSRAAAALGVAKSTLWTWLNSRKFTNGVDPKR